jgi:hypothetical protein
LCLIYKDGFGVKRKTSTLLPVRHLRYSVFPNSGW